jgi:hypothetical protein
MVKTIGFETSFASEIANRFSGFDAFKALMSNIQIIEPLL